MEDFLIVFRSRYEAMSFYNYLSSKGYNVKAVNTPRQISLSCGLSIRITGISQQGLLNLTKTKNVAIYKITPSGYVKIK